jgi:superfamily II DNA or RNA helicase
LAFTASVKQAETLSNIFNRHKPGCSEWVCGATNKDVRKEMLARFQGGEIQIMVNCNCLAEGFDDPGVEVILQARPTKSRSLYAQQIGRAMRPLPGIVDGPETPDLRKSAIAGSKKPSCLIVDFVGNSGRHKLMTSADILGGKVSDEAIERAIIKAKKDGGAVRMSDALDQADEEIRQEAEERRRAEEARKARLVAKVNYSARSVSPFDMLQIAPVKTRGWDNGRTLSEKQKAYLLRQGVNPDTIPYAQGRQLLTAMFKRMDAKLASLKQLKVLARYGYTDATMPYDQASKILDSLARNGWRKP